MTTFQGQHMPPDMGRTTVPVPIIGQGSIETGGDELVVRGTKRAGAAALMFLLTLAVLGGMIGMGILLGSTTDLTSKSIGKIVVAVGAVVGFGGLGLVRKRQAASSSEPMELKVPWAKVKKADHEPDRAGVVLIHVKRSFFNTESLHFAPEGGPHELVAALKERVGK